MGITKPTFAVNNIQTLANQVAGQATALKVLFDKTGADAKTYLVALCDEIDAELATKAEVAGIILGQITDGTLTDDKLSEDASDIKARFTAYQATITAALATVYENIDLANYNIYQLYLENYYDSKYTIKKGLFFDGFASKDVVDATNSSVLFDLTGKKIYTNDEEYIKTTTNSQDLSFRYSTSETKVGQVFKISGNLVIKSVKLDIIKNGTPTGNITCKIYNVDGDTGLPTTEIATSSTVIDGSTLDTSYGTYSTFLFGSSLTVGTYAVVLESTTTISTSNFYKVKFSSTADAYSDGDAAKFDGSAWSLVTGDDLIFIIAADTPQNAVYQSAEQTLTQDFDNAVLYVKSKTTTGCSITAEMAIYDTSATFAAMTLADTVDLGSGYQEDKFTYTSATPGNKAKVKITLNRPDVDTAFEANEYGCILGVE